MSGDLASEGNHENERTVSFPSVPADRLVMEIPEGFSRTFTVMSETDRMDMFS